MEMRLCHFRCNATGKRAQNLVFVYLTKKNMPLALSRVVFNKNRLPYSRFLVLLYTERPLTVRNHSTAAQGHAKPSSRFRDVLAYVLSLAGFSYIFYKLKKDAWQDLKWQRLSILPKVHAKRDQHRERYNFVADVVEVTSPSVVCIELKDYRNARFISGKALLPISNGAGFIVSEDGLILTNAHVVMNNKANTTVKVQLNDGSSYEGVVEDIDMQADLALVRINKKDLPALKLGDSSKLRPGEFVIAIGSPLSLYNSITTGVISSPSRQSSELGLEHKRMDYIQTDAPVTFGHSGGPLVNLDGEVIGINAMKVTTGISFAIPVDYAKEFLKRAEARRQSRGYKNLTDNKKRRYMGITMFSLTPEVVSELKARGMPSSLTHGVLIWKVMMNSPAHVSGLQPGDIITEANGQPVEAAMGIYKVLEDKGPVKLTVFRNGSFLIVTVNPEDT